MSYQQTFLALGALILFSVTILTVNRSLISHQEALLQTGATNYALPLANGYLEEAQGKAFDKKFYGGAYSDTTDLTPTASLGPEMAEAYPQFDDIDDFNGLEKTHPSTMHGSFTVKCRVGYVDPANLDVIVPQRTRLKRMEVRVAGESLPDTLLLYTVFAAYRSSGVGGV